MVVQVNSLPASQIQQSASKFKKATLSDLICDLNTDHTSNFTQFVREHPNTISPKLCKVKF